MGIKDWWASRQDAKAIPDDRDERPLRMSLFVAWDGALVGWLSFGLLDSIVDTLARGLPWGWIIYWAALLGLGIWFLVSSVKRFRRLEKIHYDIERSEGAIDAYSRLVAAKKSPEIVGYNPSNLEPVYREKAEQDA